MVSGTKNERMFPIFDYNSNNKPPSYSYHKIQLMKTMCVACFEVAYLKVAYLIVAYVIVAVDRYYHFNHLQPLSS